MIWTEIATMKTTLKRDDLKKYLDDGTKGVHESVLRSYQVLSEVKRMLKIGTPSEVILMAIEVMEEK